MASGEAFHFGVSNERLDYDHLLKMALRRAVLYGAASRLDEAFECLDQAISFRDPALVHLAVAPQWDTCATIRGLAFACRR